MRFVFLSENEVIKEDELATKFQMKNNMVFQQQLSNILKYYRQFANIEQNDFQGHTYYKFTNVKQTMVFSYTYHLIRKYIIEEVKYNS